jgi:hypothetical protein
MFIEKLKGIYKFLNTFLNKRLSAYICVFSKRPRRRWESNNTTCLKKLFGRAWTGFFWLRIGINILTIVKNVINIRVPLNLVNILICGGTISC